MFELTDHCASEFDRSAEARVAPGKRTLSAGIQRKVRGVDAAPSTTAPADRAGPASPADDPFSLHVPAMRGIEGSATTLPFLDRIQASFQGHDVSQIQAHVGGAAAEACDAIGARAYATGDHVAFEGAPDLHTAAHEAAHVVQQRAGVQLAGGVGVVGDRYEAHADAVADLVVQGRPAGALLDELAAGGGSGGAAAVQRKVKGFPYVEVKEAPGDVVNAVTADNTFPRGLSTRQLELLRDIINEKEEWTIPEVRQRLRLLDPPQLDDHDPFDGLGLSRDEGKQRDKKEKKQPKKSLDLTEHSDGGLDGEADVTGFTERLRLMPTGMMKELLSDPEALGYIAAPYKVDGRRAIALLEKAMSLALRPIDELLDEICGMPPAMIDDLERCLFGKGSEQGGFLLADYDLTDHQEKVLHCIHLQQKFYRGYQECEPTFAAKLLSDLPLLLIDVCERHPQGKRVFDHVVVILREQVRGCLSKALHSNDLPSDTTFLLACSQPIDDGRILRPARITKQTCVYTFGRVQMFCSIDGAEPVCTGRDRDRLLDGKPLEEYVLTLFGSDEKNAPMLDVNASIKCAQTMKVPGLGTFVRVICKHGLRWVPLDCVEEREFTYAEPERSDGKGKIALFGEGSVPLVEHVQQGGLGNCYLMAGLISVVNLDPKHICNMLHELDDETVAVRFFLKDRSSNLRVPRWIRVNRKIVMIDGQAIFAKVGGALWPALIEKAFGECGGGLEATGEGGQTSSVFSMILGHDAVSIEITNPSRKLDEGGSDLMAAPVHPLFMTAEQLQHFFGVSREEAAEFVREAAKVREELEKDIGKIEDRKQVAKGVERVAKVAGLSSLVTKRLLSYVDMHIPSCGITGGTYSTRAQMMHGSIVNALKRGCVVALGSKRWSSDRRGPSGEPLSDIGLAGGHAYAVIDAFYRGKQLMLVIRNPWGHTGMKYERSNSFFTSIGNLLEIPALERVSINAPEFEIDIEDVIRFFGNIYLG